MKSYLPIFLALATALASLSGCGGDEPMSDAQFLRKQQEQQLAAEREAQRIQNDIAREQLRTQQLHNQAIQQATMPQGQYAQPGVVGTAPVQQILPQDDGIGLGTVVAGAAVAGAAGYMAGKSNTSTYNTSTYNKPKVVAPSYSQPTTVVKKPVVKQPLTVTKHATSPVRKAAPKPTYRPTVKRYSSSKRR